MSKSKIKFLFFTDTHYTFKAPISRFEGNDYLNMLLQKTSNVFQIGKQNNVDFYIHGGDFFDSPDIGDSVAGAVGKIYREINEPIFAIAGNHDLIGNNIATLYQTKLGLLARVGIITIINRYEPIYFEKYGKKLQITASPSDFGIDGDKSAFILEEKKADYAIHVVHAMLLKENANFGTYMPLSSIQDSTLADVTLSGHFHLGFDTVNHFGHYFANPGALVRKNALLEEYNRMPKVVLVEIDCETNEIFLTDIYLDCAKDGSEVIDRTKLQTAKEQEKRIMDFRMSLLNKNFANNIELDKLVSVIQEEEDVEPEVIREVIKRLDAAKTGLKEEQTSNGD